MFGVSICWQLGVMLIFDLIIVKNMCFFPNAVEPLVELHKLIIIQF
jgi:hypothetical protein